MKTRYLDLNVGDVVTVTKLLRRTKTGPSHYMRSGTIYKIDKTRIYIHTIDGNKFKDTFSILMLDDNNYVVNDTKRMSGAVTSMSAL